jgi:hypothetical protein
MVGVMIDVGAEREEEESSKFEHSRSSSFSAFVSIIMAQEDGSNGGPDTKREREESTASTSSLKEHARASPSDGKRDRDEAPKRPRKADVDMAARGRRMFGMLNSTLSKAKEDNDKRSSGEAVSPICRLRES